MSVKLHGESRVMLQHLSNRDKGYFAAQVLKRSGRLTL